MHAPEVVPVEKLSARDFSFRSFLQTFRNVSEPQTCAMASGGVRGKGVRGRAKDILEGTASLQKGGPFSIFFFKIRQKRKKRVGVPRRDSHCGNLTAFSVRGPASALKSARSRTPRTRTRARKTHTRRGRPNDLPGRLPREPCERGHQPSSWTSTRSQSGGSPLKIWGKLSLKKYNLRSMHKRLFPKLRGRGPTSAGTTLPP